VKREETREERLWRLIEDSEHHRSIPELRYQTGPK